MTYTYDQMRRIARRSAVLHSQLEAFHAWYNDQIDPDQPEVWAQSWAELTGAQQSEIIRIKEASLSSADFTNFDQLLERFGLFVMGSEDANYLAHSRSMLFDAILAARQGEYDDAVRLAQASRNRLDWIVNGRQRRSPQHYRHFTEDVRASMVALVKELDRVIDRLIKARVA